MFEKQRELLNSGEQTPVAMDEADIELLIAAKADPATAYAELKDIVANYRGPVSPVLERYLVQLLEFKRRALGERPEVLPGVVEERDWIVGRFGEGAATMLFRGAENLLNGNRDGAMDLYRAAADYMDPHGLPRLFVGAFTTRARTNTTKAPALEWTREPRRPRWWRKDAARCCVLVSADDRYFLRFAEFFYTNLRRLDTACQIHFHVVNWTDECAALASRFDEDGLVSISFEQWPHRSDYTYFACARFARASEIMKRLRMPLYITDIDNRFNKPVTGEVAAELASYDVGFRFHPESHWFPWWTPAGGNVWLNNNDRGAKAADWLRAIITSRHIPNKIRRTWWLDQNALNEVRHRAIEEGFSVINLAQPSVYASHRRPEGEVADLKNKSWAKPMATHS